MLAEEEISAIKVNGNIERDKRVYTTLLLYRQRIGKVFINSAHSIVCKTLVLFVFSLTYRLPHFCNF